MVVAFSSEETVNTVTENSQRQSSITMLSGGGYVIAWETFDDSGYSDLHYQMFNEFGQRVGLERVLIADQSNHVNQVSLSALGTGFAAVWRDQSTNSIRLQRLDADGNTIGGEITVNTENYSTQFQPVVVSEPGGGLLVTWTSYNNESFTYDIRAQRFNADGSANGSEFTVNSTTTGHQYNPDAAELTNGTVVVWDYGNDIFAQRYDATGAAVGAEFQVNTDSTDGGDDQKVVGLVGGGFVVVWTDRSGADSSGQAVLAQIFDATGAAVGAPLLVNVGEPSSQNSPDVTQTADGGFFVTWYSDYDAGTASYTYDIMGRHFDATGTPLTGEIILNENSANTPQNPTVDVLSNGLIVVSWDNTGIDGDDRSVQQRVFAPDGSLVTAPESPEVGGFNSAVSFLEADLNSGPQLLDADGSVAFSDADNTDFDGGRLILGRLINQEENVNYNLPNVAFLDAFGIRNEGVGAGQIGVSSGNVTYGGTVIGTITEDGMGGGNLIVSFTADADESAIEALLENLTYATSSDAPSSQFSLILQIEDGQGGTSEPHIISVSVAQEVDAPTPVGSGDRQVNSFTSSNQDQPDVAAIDSGGWVTVWTSYGQESAVSASDGVFGQRFDINGNPVGPEFQVNSVNSSAQNDASVAGIHAGPNAGGWVVTWYDAGLSAEGYVRAQIFNAAGDKVGSEIAVPSNVTFHAAPAIETFDDGSFVIAWYGYWPSGGSPYDVMAQRFEADGTPLGAQEQVNTTTPGTQSEVSVSTFASGDFVVSWTDSTAGDIKARVMRPAGVDGAEFTVNTSSTGTQNTSDVTVLSNGNVLITWSDSSSLDGSGWGVFGQLYDGSGAAIGEQFQVNSHTHGTQYQASIAPWGAGGFVVSYSGYTAAARTEIVVQYFNADGQLVDSEITVSSDNRNGQFGPRIEELQNGDHVVVWQDQTGADGSGYGVFQRVLGDPANYLDEANAPQVSGLDETITFAEADVNAAPQILDSSMSISDADSADMDGGELRLERISSNFWQQDLFAVPDNAEQDNLGIRDQGTSAGQIGVSGTSVTFGGTLIGTITSDGKEGSALIVEFNSDATPLAVQALARNITYMNASDDPAASRVFRLMVSDGDGGASTPALVTLNVDTDTEGLEVIGVERQVNTVQYQSQTQPVISGLSDGGYVITWESRYQDEVGSAYGVFGQRYGADGVPVGEEFQINTNETGSQYQSDVAGFAAGGFVATWYDDSAPGGFSVRAQIFNASGQKVGGEIEVETDTYSTQNQPSVVTLSGGGFVVAWASVNNTNFTWDIRAQVFDATGAKVGSEFTLNTTTAGTQALPDLVSLAGGGFAAVWEDQSSNDGSGYGVYGRIFDAAGAPVSAEILINTVTAGSQYEPSIAELSTGGFVVAWRDSNGLDGSSSAVFAQRLDAAGAKVGDAFLVNDIVSGAQYDPTVVAMDGGEFAVVYTSDSGDGSGAGVFAQVYNSDFSRKDGAVQINTLTSSTQYHPEATMLANGDIAVAFSSNNSGTAGDGSGYGIFHQILTTGNTYPNVENSPQISGLDTIVYMALADIGTAAVLDNAINVTDLDSSNLDGGVLLYQVKGPWASSDDQLTVEVGKGIALSGSNVQLNGVTIGVIDATNDGSNGADLEIALNTNATPDAVHLLMEQVAYANSGASLTTSSIVSIGITLSDGAGGRSTPISIYIDIQSSVSVPNFVFDDLDSSVVMSEMDLNAAPQVIDGNVDFEYNGANGLENGYLYVEYSSTPNNRQGPDFETLAVENQGIGAGQIGVSGTDITYGGTIIGTIDATEDGLGGNELRIDFNASATSEAIDALIEALTYQTTSDGPASEVDLRYRVYDGGGAASSYRYLTINITPEDDGGLVALGDEERVNSEVANSQDESDVAALTDGGYVIVWRSRYQDTGSSDYGIFGQRYDAEGEPVGAEFQVNDNAIGSQNSPTVTGLANGGFAVGWDGAYLDGEYSAHAKFYDAAGASAGEFRFSPNSNYAPTDLDATTLSNGNVLISWHGYNSDGNHFGVEAQIFDEAGVAQAGVISVNTYVASSQDSVAVAANGAGGFVAVWDSNGQDGSSEGIYAQRFTAAGAFSGAEFKVNTETGNDQSMPSVVQLDDGGFVVAWRSYSQDGDRWGVYQQRYDASGTAVGGEVLVNSWTGSSQYETALVALDNGGWLVTWRDDAGSGGDSSASGVIGQAYDVNGDAIDGNFLVNENTYYYQYQPSAARLADGRVVVSYTSGGADGDDTGYGIAHRLFGFSGATEQSLNPEISGFTTTAALNEADVNAGYVQLDAGVAASISDSDSSDFDGGRLIIARPAGYHQAAQYNSPDDGTQDNLTLMSVDVAIVGGLNVQVNGVTVGTITSDGQDGEPLIVEFNGNATPARVEALLNALHYSNPSDDPEDSRDFRIVLTDGEGGVGEHFVTVNVSQELDGVVALTDERQVNSFVANSQNDPDVASLSGGGFVAVWTSQFQDTQSSDYGVYAQVHNAAGFPVGAEIHINTTVSGNQYQPSVIGLDDGTFVVVWYGQGSGDTYGVFGQRFDADGSALGAEFRVNADVSGTETAPTAVAFAGGFAIMWQDSNLDGSGTGINSRFYDNDGTATTGEVAINTTTLNHQYAPEAALLSDGNIAVVWHNEVAGGNDDISLKVVNTSGVQVVAEQTVNTHTSQDQVNAFVTALAGGGMVVAWSDASGKDGSGYGVYAQILSNAGTPVGNEFLVNEVVNSTQSVTGIVGLSTGGFVIAWQSAAGQDGSGWSVMGQEYDASGNRIDSEFVINQQFSSTQESGVLTALSDGAFAAVWSSTTSGAAGDGSAYGIFQRIFGPEGTELNTSDAPLLSALNPSVTFDENTINAAPGLIDANNSVAISDDDSADFDGGTLRVDLTTVQTPLLSQLNPPDDISQERLGLRQDQGITIAGTTVSVNGTEVGEITKDGDGGESFEIAFNGNATPEIVELLIENLTYQNLSDDPIETRTLRVQISDGDGGYSEPQMIAVSITPEVDGNAPLLTERQANTTTDGNQTESHVAQTDFGFVMVWTSYNNEDSTANSYGVFGQRFDANGNKLGDEFQINTAEAGSQTNARVIGTQDGGFAVVWYDQNISDIKMQRFDGDGAVNGGEFTVNSHTVSTQYQPDITELANGDQLVVWTTWSHTAIGGSSYDVVGQVFDGTTGLAQGSEFLINQQTSGSQSEPSVTALADGGFAVSWTSQTSGAAGDGNGNGVFARRFLGEAGSYSAAVPEFQVNDVSAGNQSDSKVTGLTGGGYVVTFADHNGLDGSGVGIFAQMYDASDTPVGDQFRVNEFTNSTQDLPEITALSNGGFAISFAGYSNIGSSGYGVFLQQYDALGRRIDGTQLVNTETSSTQTAPSIAGLDDGGLVVGWTSQTSGDAGDGSGNGIFYQIFKNNAPTTVDVSATTDEDTLLVLDRAMFEAGYSDPEDQPLALIRIEVLPFEGTLFLDNVEITTVTEITVAQLDAGLLTFLPDADYNGIDSFTWSGSDGSNFSPVPAQTNITVTAVNDPVGLTVGGDTSIGEGQNVARQINFSDPDSGQTYEVTVDYGDGSALSIFNTTSKTPTLNHSFSAEGVFTVSVSVDDGNGSVETDSFQTTVVNAPPVARRDNLSTNEDTILSDNLFENNGYGIDSDPGGDTFTVTAINGSAYTLGAAFVLASGATVTVAANGGIDYDPTTSTSLQSMPDGDNTIDTFTYRITDEDGLSNTATVYVNVSGADDNVVVQDDSFQVGEDSEVLGNVFSDNGNGIDFDPEGDGITVVAINGQALNVGTGVTLPGGGILTVDSDGSFAFDASGNYDELGFGDTRTVQFTYVAEEDGSNLQATGTGTILINGVNDDPVAQDDVYAATEDTTLTVANAALGVRGNDSDVDGDSLTVTLLTDVSSGTLTLNANGTFNYIPDADFSGADSFTYTLSDGNGGSDTATVTLNVAEENDDPVAENDTYTVDEDDTLTVNLPGVLANDTDPDGDGLTVTLNSDVSNGTLVLADDGSFTYTPDANFFGPDSFTYSASDGNGGSNIASVTINVTSINDAPVGVADTYATSFETQLIIGPRGVLGNDSDVETPLSLVASLDSDVSHGTLVLNPDGSFEYTPDDGFTGQDSFTYFAIDPGTASSVSTTATINVAPANNTDPVAVDDSYNVNEDDTLTILLPGILSNDSDTDGDSLTATVASNVSDGTLNLAADGSFTYTPDANFNGIDSFTYTLSDGNGGLDTGTVTLNVAAVNDDPVAANDSYNVDEDNTLTVILPGVLANDSDLEGHTLSATVLGDVSHGTLSLASDGSFTYTPDADFFGDDSFTYTLSDGNGGTDVGSVTINVASVNDEPVFTSSSTFSVDENTTTVGQLAGSDVEGNSLTFAIAGGADSALFEISGTGVLSFIDAPDFEAPADDGGDNVYDIELSVFDGTDSTTQTVQVTVEDVDEILIVEGTSESETLVGTDADEIMRGLGGRIDVAIGGGGADTFEFFDSVGRNQLRIMDYDQSEGDVLDLNGETIASTIVAGSSTYIFLDEADQDIIVISGLTDPNNDLTIV